MVLISLFLYFIMSRLTATATANRNKKDDKARYKSNLRFLSS